MLNIALDVEVVGWCGVEWYDVVDVARAAASRRYVDKLRVRSKTSVKRGERMGGERAFVPGRAETATGRAKGVEVESERRSSEER